MPGGSDPRPSGTFFVCLPPKSPVLRDRLYSPNYSILCRFMSTMPFVVVASTTTSAPKVQVITYLVCKTLRPEYTNRSPRITLSAADDEGIKLCNADPVVGAASAEFLACTCPPRQTARAPEPNPLDPKSNHHCNWYSELLNHRILGISKLTHSRVHFPQHLMWTM